LRLLSCLGGGEVLAPERLEIAVPAGVAEAEKAGCKPAGGHDRSFQGNDWVAKCCPTAKNHPSSGGKGPNLEWQGAEPPNLAGRVSNA